MSFKYYQQNIITRIETNQPYARVNQSYAMLSSALGEMFRVQLYKNNARALLSHILSILNLDLLQHARSACVVYVECT